MNRGGIRKVDKLLSYDQKNGSFKYIYNIRFSKYFYNLEDLQNSRLLALKLLFICSKSARIRYRYGEW